MDGADDIDALLRCADAHTVKSVDLGSYYGRDNLDIFYALITRVAQIVEMPCTYYLIVIGQDLSLLESDTCLTVSRYVELELVEVVALVEELYSG